MYQENIHKSNCFHIYNNTPNNVGLNRLLVLIDRNLKWLLLYIKRNHTSKENRIHSFFRQEIYLVFYIRSCVLERSIEKKEDTIDVFKSKQGKKEYFSFYLSYQIASFLFQCNFVRCKIYITLFSNQGDVVCMWNIVMGKLIMSTTNTKKTAIQ